MALALALLALLLHARGGSAAKPVINVAIDWGSTVANSSTAVSAAFPPSTRSSRPQVPGADVEYSTQAARKAYPISSLKHPKNTLNPIPSENSPKNVPINNPEQSSPKRKLKSRYCAAAG